MLITVLTPTYNRAKLLNRLYQSLCQQTVQDFEWIIINDGSKDNTDNVVQSFIDEGIIKIKYIKQENGGKHRAINHGVREAKGELILILDSDDSLPPTSIETILRYYIQIKDDVSFGGVAGYMAHHDGTFIGHCSTKGIIDATSFEYRYKYNATGDMCEVFKTEVLKENPFPEVPDEKFCPEMLLIYRIAKKYKLRWFHDIIYYRDYLDNGLTDRIVQIRMKSPILTMMSYAEKIKLDIPWEQKLKCAINYYRFKFCLTKEHKEIVIKEKIVVPRISKKWIFCYPLSLLMHQKDRLNS